MKGDMLFVFITFIVIVVLAVIANQDALMPEKYVAGRIYIRARGISAEVFTHEADPIDGMSTLWNGGKVTVKEDMSSVQVGDMAELYTVEGEHLVMECISITGVPSWLLETEGDVLVVNGRLVYRLTRL